MLYPEYLKYSKQDNKGYDQYLTTAYHSCWSQYVPAGPDLLSDLMPVPTYWDWEPHAFETSQQEKWHEHNPPLWTI